MEDSVGAAPQSESSGDPREAGWLGLVLAGGRGSRLGSESPKPLAQVGGCSLVELGIRQLASAGAREIHVALHQEAARIVAHLEPRIDSSLEMRWILEPEPLGTIGAIAALRGRGLPVLSVNGDLVSGIDLAALLRAHRASGAAATLAVHTERHRLRLGEVQLEGGDRIVAYEEKPTKEYRISSGISLFEPEVVDLVGVDERLDVPELVQRALDRGLILHAFQHARPWMDVNTPHELASAARFYEDHLEAFAFNRSTRPR